MENERADASEHVKPEFGSSGYFCIELFCGSGNLTFAMKHFFPDSFGVDHKVAKQRVKVICLDLTRNDHQALVIDWATSGKCLWVHFGVPCGTASRARFKRMNKTHHGPPPLRSARWPDGLPRVSGVNLARLRAANRLYRFMSELILTLDQLRITWTVENPWTSLLWLTSYWKSVDEKLKVWYCELHNCMFGGTRLKRTCLASNNRAVMALNILCSNDHEHAPWSIQDGMFDTAREAEYTPQLAKALATTILEAVAGALKLPNVSQVSKRLKLSHFHAIAAGKQPTKMTSLPTVPEFSHILIVHSLPQQFVFDVRDGSLQHCTVVQAGDNTYLVPCGSKLLRKTERKGGESRLFSLTVDRAPSLQALGDVDSGVAVTGGAHLVCNRGICACKEPHLKLERLEIVGDCNDFVFGVRWSPEQFLEQAVLVGHPFREFSGLLPEVKLAREKLTSWSHEDLVNWRCKKLGEWLRLAKSLQGEERALKDRMPEARRRILERKRVALMRHLIRQEGYDDHTLADDIEFGFSLVGDCPKSSVLPSKLVPATISEDDLRRHSAKASKALRYMTRSSGDVELDAGLWTKTMTEVEKGWLIGPIPWETLPVGAAVSRRFPLSQAGKVRPIDDLSQSQVNSTVNTFEQATVDGPDVICSLATYLMRCLVDQGRSSCLKGRSLDLASAYRQLAIADESLQHSYLSVYDPESGSAKLFQQVALPFGSRSAVNAFIRCARFLQWIAAKVFILPLTCYFDDFVAFPMPSLCNNSQSTLCLMLDILGWRFDREGPKSDDFSESVSALGVLFDLTESERGILRVCNTTKRINDTTLILDDVLSNGRLVKKDALSLRGKLAFCDAFIFGRVGKLALQDITKHAYANPFVSQLSERLVESLRRLRGRLVSGSPRVLTCKMLETFFLFTDASFCRSSGGGFGAFLAAPDGTVISWFGIHVEAERFARWFEHGRQNLIGEFETLVVDIALRLWGRLIASSQLMVYIDNEGAKFALIRGYSDSPAISSICQLVALHLDEFYILPWYSRVPSVSNLADCPSRKIQHRLLEESASVPEGEVASLLEESLCSVESHICEGGVRG